MANHRYRVSAQWVGNLGSGTVGYKSYLRDTVVRASGKPELRMSADKIFFGDASQWNPEEALLAALVQCHMLSFLHLASSAGVVVESYEDHAEGILETTTNGSGKMLEVTLHPNVEISTGDLESLTQFHKRAREMCFIANSMNFPVKHQPSASNLSRA